MTARLDAARRELREALSAARKTLEDGRGSSGPATQDIDFTDQDPDDARAHG